MNGVRSAARNEKMHTGGMAVNAPAVEVTAMQDTTGMAADVPSVEITVMKDTIGMAVNALYVEIRAMKDMSGMAASAINAVEFVMQCTIGPKTVSNVLIVAGGEQAKITGGSEQSARFVENGRIPKNRSNYCLRAPLKETAGR